MKVVLVYNLHSGRALTLDNLKKSFQNAHIEIVDSFVVNRNIRSLLRPYLSKKGIVIAAYGGDGTLSRVASAIANTECIFAPLPGGTLNHFTKDLGIEQNLDTALHALKNSKPQTIDIACVNGRSFINNSSIGLYPSTLQMRDEMTRKFIGKWPAAVIASFKAFWRYDPYTVTINGETFRTPFVFVGNNDYRLEHHLIGYRKHLDKGILSVYTVVATGRINLLGVFIRAVFHLLEGTDEVKMWKTSHVTIHTKRPQVRISRDGEHETIESPLRYKVMPNALKVIGASKK